MIKVYTLFSCTSCRKVIEILTHHQIPFMERNIERDPLTRQEALHILSLTEGGTEDVSSIRSRVAREIGHELNEGSLEQWIQQVIENPKLLRAPLLLNEKKLVVGYVRDYYDSLINRCLKHYSLKQSS